MQNLRIYGNSPFRVVVIHGGPGAPGYMAPVARELADEQGVLEPLQTAGSLEGQIQELKAILTENTNLPVILIGSSWGAMLSFIFTARYSEFVKKLILVGSGVYENKYDLKITKTRLERLSKEEKKQVYYLMNAMHQVAINEKNSLLAKMAELFTKADTYDPLTLDIEVIEYQYQINDNVWQEVEELRTSGELLALGKQINCPVVAIHGDYDPHPAEGVQKPLSSVLKDFKFYLLKQCGHMPWIEKKAREKFYKILKAELH